MFADAISLTDRFTRPIKFIHRNYQSTTVVPGAATLFFINDDGYALTCAHVAREFRNSARLNQEYRSFRQELAALPKGKKYAADLRRLEHRFGYTPDKAVQLKFAFDWIENMEGKDIDVEITMSNTYDIALVRFSGYKTIHKQGHAVFAKDTSLIRPGKMLCRLGFPFPEFSNFVYDPEKDDIAWSQQGNPATPRFPIEGMMTRHLADQNGKTIGIEMSTPGLRGQSGGPLFTEKGIVCGFQSATYHLHLGFDMKKEKKLIDGKMQIVNNQPFLHVGHCVHVDVIKEFLNEHRVKYFVGDTYDRAEAVNG